MVKSAGPRRKHTGIMNLKVNRAFYSDLKDGVVLLQLYGHLDDDIVDWKKVNQPPYTVMGEFFACTRILQTG